MIVKLLSLISAVPIVCWVISKYRKRLRIDVMEHAGEEWDVLKSNLFLEDSSLGLRISAPNCILHSGIKRAHYQNRPGNMHDNDDRSSWCEAFAREIEDAMRQHLREITSVKEIKKIIKGAYKQAQIRRRGSI